MSPDEMHAALVDWYSESPTGPAQDLYGSKTQLWTSVRNDTWTLVRYETPAAACVMAQGTDVSAAPQTTRVMAGLVTDG